jgi:lantibiotic biosynthesis protein
MYQFFPRLILRSPVYTAETYRKADLQQLLTDPYFQAALHLASASLFRELEKHRFDLQVLPPDVLFTLRKYLNRMCFRPTPFGMFSGVTTVAWTGDSNTPVIRHREGLKVRAALSYGEAQKLAQELLAHELAPYHTYRSNAAIYRAGDEFRYLRYAHVPAGGTRDFFLDSVQYGRFLQALLTFCQAEKSRSAVICFIRETLAAGEAESSAFFEQLTEQQLLVSTLEANITGEDYLHRLLRVCRSLGLDTPRIRNFSLLLASLETVSAADGPAAFRAGTEPGISPSQQNRRSAVPEPDAGESERWPAPGVSEEAPGGSGMPEPVTAHAGAAGAAAVCRHVPEEVRGKGPAAAGCP